MSEVLAGKIGVTNGGEWNAETYYEEATFVRHQNNLYLSNLASTGIEPTNEEYWMLAMEGFSGEDVQTLIDSINNIIDGTTQVGNAKTLDGHGAEYFAPLEALRAFSGMEAVRGATVEEINALYDNYSVGMPAGTCYRAIITHGVAHPILQGGQWLLEGFKSSDLYECQMLRSYMNGKSYYFRDKLNGVWQNYVRITTTVDLANYLSLTGGTVSNGGMHPFSIKGASTTSLLRYFNSASELQGYLGFVNDKPVFQSKTNTASELLHTGNKPTGTYTGNGDATERTVNIGGVGETLRIVNSALGIAFVTNDGAHCITRDGFLIIPPSECKFANGTLTMATTASVVNANGYGFSYDLL